MTENQLNLALNFDAIFGKSKRYICKALSKKEEGDLDEYQLWASLALELLGKAALSKIHPCLIADPNHFQSIFAAAGKNISTDIKTITANTLFDRLRHVIPHFDEPVRKFCAGISLRRNAELHSGETPFCAMRLEVWEPRYWHASQVILHGMGASLGDWLDVSQADVSRRIIKFAMEAKCQAVSIRVNLAKEVFETRTQADRNKAIEESKHLNAYHYKNLFTFSEDHRWACVCPSCNGKAYMAGLKTDEEVIDQHDDDPDGAWEEVETHYSAEQLHCPVCDLFLDGYYEIECAKLDIYHSEIKEREMEYVQEYGNE
ncbi:MAG: hypothetical protein HQL90_14675 [Magnetococcales bacterium]|nr:hypothetical protein [Magnetococcales bacterium]